MTSLPNISTQWQRFAELSPPALYELLRFRQQIFVVEQRSPYPDLDGLDFSARHLTARRADTLAGYLRVLPPTDPAAALHIGRVAVASGLRGRGLGRRLMLEALALCRENHPGQPVSLAAQLSLVRFYEGFGFVVAGEPYDDFGVAHVEMELPLAAPGSSPI